MSHKCELCGTPVLMIFASMDKEIFKNVPFSASDINLLSKASERFAKKVSTLEATLKHDVDKIEGQYVEMLNRLRRDNEGLLNSVKRIANLSLKHDTGQTEYSASDYEAIFKYAREAIAKFGGKK